MSSDVPVTWDPLPGCPQCQTSKGDENRPEALAPAGSPSPAWECSRCGVRFGWVVGAGAKRQELPPAGYPAWDELVRCAVRRAGQLVGRVRDQQTQEGPLEPKQLTPALMAGLTELGVHPSQVISEYKERTEGNPNGWTVTERDWCPFPVGGIDLAVRDESGALMLAAEVKVWEIQETIFDLLKLTAIAHTEWPPVTYLIAAATEKQWKDKPCAELFPTAGPECHKTRDLLTGKILDTWRDTLDYKRKGNKNAVPQKAPAKIITSPVAIDAPLADCWECKHTIRAARISHGEGYVEFDPNRRGEFL